MPALPRPCKAVNAMPSAHIVHADMASSQRRPRQSAQAAAGMTSAMVSAAAARPPIKPPVVSIE
jgi:hypothetical protein